MRVQVLNVPAHLVGKCGAEPAPGGGFFIDDQSECYRRHFAFMPPPRHHRQLPPRASVSRTAPGNVLADLLEAAINLVDVAPTAPGDCAACHNLRDEMNRRGWAWCLLHAPRIFHQVKQNAKRLGVRVDRSTWRKFLTRGAELADGG